MFVNKVPPRKENKRSNSEKTLRRGHQRRSRVGRVITSNGDLEDSVSWGSWIPPSNRGSSRITPPV